MKTHSEHTTWCMFRLDLTAVLGQQVSTSTVHAPLHFTQCEPHCNAPTCRPQQCLVALVVAPCVNPAAAPSVRAAPFVASACSAIMHHRPASKAPGPGPASSPGSVYCRDLPNQFTSFPLNSPASETSHSPPARRPCSPVSLPQLRMMTFERLLGCVS